MVTLFWILDWQLCRQLLLGRLVHGDDMIGHGLTFSGEFILEVLIEHEQFRLVIRILVSRINIGFIGIIFVFVFIATFNLNSRPQG